MLRGMFSSLKIFLLLMCGLIETQAKTYIVLFSVLTLRRASFILKLMNISRCFLPVS